MQTLNVLTTKLHTEERNNSRRPLIAVSRSLRIASIYPAIDRERSGIHHADQSNDANQDIEQARGGSACHSAVMQHGLLALLVESFTGIRGRKLTG